MTEAPKLPDTASDPVDWARHYWEQQGLDGDEQRFLALTSLLRYQRIVTDAVDAELRTHGLNMTDYLLLMTLQLSETGTRLISSLARNLLVHATTATLATDRLEQRGMLQRSPHPTDRRATCVTISDLGRKTADKATRGLTGIDFGMQGSSDANINRLRNLLTTMRHSLGDA
ncbi:MarR family winged helix-turn-helix transcriptional regulator [Nocardia alni]|uniref:MarR family winged helix-turn-helix transcriptional regulator n=1 Tax=Nocardia alni TaxID=2815723 RepID=UPI001C23DF9E|nr:MarR family transcriptional regulator [Nocardia alni]